MKLIFSTDTTEFAKEFKESLGFVDANFPFQKIAQDLFSATANLISEIGQETYDEIAEIYEKPNPTETEKETLRLAKTAIANHAYTLFAPSNDLQHGVNGRKMLTSNDSKTPFEHMLVASNDELERRIFRSKDNLLNYLDANNAIWKASENYKASHRNFVRTVTEFNLFYVIDSRYLLLKLSPGLALSEKREIIPRIGKEKFQQLKEKRKNNTDLNDAETHLLSLIQEATVYDSLSWGIPRLQATLFPSGLFYEVRSDRATISGRSVPLGNQVDQMKQLFRKDAESTFLEIERLVAPPPPVPTERSKEKYPFGFCPSDKFVT